MGGKFHLKLNNGERPIANKYREGKMKRTLKRELKVLEIAKREALPTSDMRSQTSCAPSARACSWQLCLCALFGGAWLVSVRQSRSIRLVREKARRR